MLSTELVRSRLDVEELPELLVRLGFADDDAVETIEAVRVARRRPRELAFVAEATEALTRRVGLLGNDDGADPWSDLPEGRGDLAILALLTAAPAVRAEHRRRGIPDEISWASLADLGQQVGVNRRTHGRFGLDTYGWMLTAWSGGLIWLGRLQFVPKRTVTGWVLDVHIPASGPLRPADVDASFEAAVPFFRRHFPEINASAFACTSWMLDPVIPELLPESNLAAFQRRWTLTGAGYQADESVAYFAFGRRVPADEPLDLDSLPVTTSLHRAVLAHLRSGGHWHVHSGTAPLPGAALP